jgi:hypothetical protein
MPSKTPSMRGKMMSKNYHPNRLDLQPVMD